MGEIMPKVFKFHFIVDHGAIHFADNGLISDGNWTREDSLVKAGLWASVRGRQAIAKCCGLKPSQITAEPEIRKTSIGVDLIFEMHISNDCAQRAMEFSRNMAYGVSFADDGNRVCNKCGSRPDPLAGTGNPLCLEKDKGLLRKHKATVIVCLSCVLAFLEKGYNTRIRYPNSSYCCDLCGAGFNHFTPQFMGHHLYNRKMGAASEKQTSISVCDDCYAVLMVETDWTSAQRRGWEDLGIRSGGGSHLSPLPSQSRKYFT